LKYGPQNPNYRTGKYSVAPDCTDVKIAVEKDKLRKILTTPFADDGSIPGFTPQDAAWAREVIRERPDWAEQTLKDLRIIG
jgi:hypothetical protein